MEMLYQLSYPSETALLPKAGDQRTNFLIRNIPIARFSRTCPEQPVPDERRPNKSDSEKRAMGIEPT